MTVLFSDAADARLEASAATQIADHFHFSKNLLRTPQLSLDSNFCLQQDLIGETQR
jgi:hypothetical protein